MSTDPWMADDPRPGDFDAALSELGSTAVEHQAGTTAATLRVLASIDGEDVGRLKRLTVACGGTAGGLLAALLRDVDETVD
jgi:hypothetical protein